MGHDSFVRLGDGEDGGDGVGGDVGGRGEGGGVMEMPRMPKEFARGVDVDVEMGLEMEMDVRGRAGGKAGGKAGGVKQMEVDEEPDWWVGQTAIGGGADEDGIALEDGDRSVDVDVDLDLERGDVLGYERGRDRGVAM